MRLLADTNIVATAVRALLTARHDDVYVAERPIDPGDTALLAEARLLGRVFLTKDHDIGVLIHRDGQPHAGVLLIDDLGSAAAETNLILAAIEAHDETLTRGAFLRATAGGVRTARD